MNHTDMGDAEWRSSTRRLHGPGGTSNMSSVLGFGYSSETGANKNERNEKNDKNDKNTEKNDAASNNNNNNNNSISDSNNKVNVGNESKDEACDGGSSDGIIVKCDDASKVRQFTFEAGQNTPIKPSNAMNCDEVKFIGKMILDELLELFSTVMEPQDAKTTLKNMLDNAKSIPKMNASSKEEEYKLIAEQCDAFVDIWYYSLNAACKKGVNCSKIFDIVHNANMAKRDPKTKKFLKRKDGKIIKPKGWQPPNVEKEIQRQMQHGAWD